MKKKINTVENALYLRKLLRCYTVIQMHISGVSRKTSAVFMYHFVVFLPKNEKKNLCVYVRQKERDRDTEILSGEGFTTEQHQGKHLYSLKEMACYWGRQDAALDGSFGLIH